MFCPRCSAGNKLEQKYCRQCGLPLPAVRLALEGQVGEATAEIKKDYDLLSGGAVTLAIFILVAFVNFFLSSEKNWAVIFNLVLGLLIAAPMIYKGLARLERSIKLIEPQGAPLRPSVNQAAPHTPLPAVPDTDPLALRPSAPGSVAEHTTLDLKQSEPR